MSEYCTHCMEPAPAGATCPHCGCKDSPEVQPYHLSPGTVLDGHYLVGEVLGQGGFGITYIGRDLRLDTRVAIKEYYPTGYANRNTGVSNTVTANTGKGADYYIRGRQRFLDEAQALAKYSKVPGVVDVMNFFEENGTAYIVMELLQGHSLQDETIAGGRLSADWVFDKFAPIMDALEHMHRDGLVHRDVSPDNIMLLDDGTLCLMDLGSARVVDPDDPQKTKSTLVKDGYTPAEQYSAKSYQGPWTDIYSLCATMYTCITGQKVPSAFDRLKDDRIAWPSELGIPITPVQEAVLRKGMQPETENRFQSIAEMRAAIDGKISLGAQPKDKGPTTRYVPPNDDESVEIGGRARGQGFAGQNRVDNIRGMAGDLGAGYCQQCGAPLTPGNRFCTQCGRPISEPVKPNDRVRESDPKGKLPIAKIVIAVALATLLIVLGLNYGAVTDAVGCSSSQSTGAATETTTETETETESDTHAATQRASLSEYSWSELSAISGEIAEADEPIEVAKYYNLVDSSGKLDNDQVKAVTYKGDTHYVRIIGFAHDDKVNGGKAGLTFQFTDILSLKPMKDTRDNSGGWAYDNKVRTWLEEKAFGRLPSDLQDAIVSVEKKTNNVGETTDTSSVSATSDKLWLPSFCEVYGKESYGENSAVLDAEGTQYKRYKDEGVTAAHDSTESVKNPTLVMEYKGTATSWWLRSPNPDGPKTFFDVYSVTGEWNGSYADNDKSIGVSFCFCL